MAWHDPHAGRRGVRLALVRGDHRANCDGLPLCRPLTLGLEPNVAERPTILKMKVDVIRVVSVVGMGSVVGDIDRGILKTSGLTLYGLVVCWKVSVRF